MPTSETNPQDIHKDPNIKITETDSSTSVQSVPKKKESKFTSMRHNATSGMKSWKSNFVSLQIERQFYILLSFILTIALIFAGAFAQILMLVLIIPLLLDGITGRMFISRFIKKLPWNKKHRAEKELEKEVGEV